MIKNKSQKARFSAIGGINTVFDFGLLFSLKALGLPAIPANIISTAAAFCFSFFANKKFTFRTTSTSVRREIILFTIVTLFGLWVLQTIVISLVTTVLLGINIPDNFILFIAKLLATVTSLIWNYMMYSRVVFKQKEAL